jgi:hypothetical protein
VELTRNERKTKKVTGKKRKIEGRLAMHTGKVSLLYRKMGKKN